MPPSTTTEIFISLVEIMLMLMPCSPSVSNTFAATPECVRMPTPTTDTFAIFSSAMISPNFTSACSSSITFFAFAKSGLSAVNEISVAGVAVPWLMFCTIMSMFTAALASVLNTRAAIPG